MSLAPARKGRISLAEQKRRNQAAMDFYADIADKPRVERFAPEKRAPAVHDPGGGMLEKDVVQEVFRVLRNHSRVAWFARMNSGEFVSDDRHIRGYVWYSRVPEDVKAKSAGISDFVGQFVTGMFFAIEVKREKGGIVSADQEKFLSCVEAGSGRATVVRSGREAQLFLDGRHG